MYDNGIIVYDDVITYAINNLNCKADRVYIDDPSRYIDSYDYRKTPLYRLYDHNPKKPFMEYPYPQARYEDTRVTKYTGINMVYIESYGNETLDHPEIGSFTVFDEEFLSRIKDNVKYCCQCEGVNWKLRNAIISYYNNEEVRFDQIELEDKKSIENFYLIPLILGIYKRYIEGLQ